ncbi:MAG: hypothetical protein ACOYD3_14010 [Kiritimatiellia bacterium]|jgi:hypothetical protein
MRTQHHLLLTSLCAALLPALAAQAQMPSADEIGARVARADATTAAVKNPHLKRLAGIQDRGAVFRYNALRVAEDLKDGEPAASFVWYTVPALSNIQRLPDQFPVDGSLGTPLRVVAARDEFEPASFVVYPFADAKALQVTAGDLRTPEGHTIPAGKVDVKLVKVWYQNGNGWYSYFGDVGLKLVPELLVNDENLIKVDTRAQANYLRVDFPSGSKYVWISAPEAIDPGLNSASAPVNDAATLQPVTLEAGQFKQFMVTIRVDKDARPGLYTGTLRLTLDGRAAGGIPVRLRVLPYVLPEPKTYYDPTADFYTMLYCVPGVDGYYWGNGRDRAQSDAKQLARLRNQYDHNIRYPLYFGMWKAGLENLPQVETALAQARSVGMRLDPFFEAFGCSGGDATERYYANRYIAEQARREYGRLLGHTRIYPAGGEEPGYNSVVNSRPNWRTVHELGMFVMCNGHDRRHFAGYNDDFRVGGGFASQWEADFMHRIKGKIGNYAGPHTGPENPDYMRRMHGLNLYKKDYDMMYNYGYQDAGWNDLVGFYRNMNLVYATKDDFIDTLAWEGIREGIDDIRYATLLQQLANRAIAAGTAATDKYYAGRKALQFLALLDEEACGLDAARAEMIRHIGALASLVGDNK